MCPNEHWFDYKNDKLFQYSQIFAYYMVVTALFSDICIPCGGIHWKNGALIYRAPWLHNDKIWFVLKLLFALKEKQLTEEEKQENERHTNPHFQLICLSANSKCWSCVNVTHALALRKRRPFEMVSFSPATLLCLWSPQSFLSSLVLKNAALFF